MSNVETNGTDEHKQRTNVRIAVACLAFFSGMIGLAYASVPLYELFCRVTGYGGTTQVAELAPIEVLDQKITVRFDSNTGSGLGWDFAPGERQVEIKIGEVTQVAYQARNWRPVASTGSATFNVTPQAAGVYFNKMECFCFTETTLQSGEEMDMPVVFFIDPAIVDSKELKDITTITLSYTFFQVDDPVAETAAAPIETETPALAPGAASLTIDDRG